MPRRFRAPLSDAVCAFDALPSLGITVRFAASDNPADVAPLIDENTCAVFCESVGNPAGNICDIAALAEIAHAGGVPLVVDNTVATPIPVAPDRARRRRRSGIR